MAQYIQLFLQRLKINIITEVNIILIFEVTVGKSNKCVWEQSSLNWSPGDQLHFVKFSVALCCLMIKLWSFPANLPFSKYPLESKIALSFKNTVFPKFPWKCMVSHVCLCYLFLESDFHSHYILPSSAHRPAFHPDILLKYIYSLITCQIRRIKQCFPIFYSYSKEFEPFPSNLFQAPQCR